MPDQSSNSPRVAHDPDETPEDVATLYSWANLHGAKYRDFSGARAQAREEARLRAEEAAAAERRRLEEEAELRRQEEAQLIAREAAEAAEAARQAEAERLAEIARQAEVERQAVLAAQEAQRQAVLQRQWQSPTAEGYSNGYSPVSGMPEPYEYHPAELTPASSVVPSPSAGLPYLAPDPAANYDPGYGSILPSAAAREPLYAAFSAEPERRESAPLPALQPVGASQAVAAPSAPAPAAPVAPASRAPAAPGWIASGPAPEQPDAFAIAAGYATGPGTGVAAGNASGSAAGPQSAQPGPAYPSRQPIERAENRRAENRFEGKGDDSYLTSPWPTTLPEEREQPVRPAWLVPELTVPELTVPELLVPGPAAVAPLAPESAQAPAPRPVPMYAQSVNQPPYAPPQPPPQSRPAQESFPRYMTQTDPGQGMPNQPGPGQASPDQANWGHAPQSNPQAAPAVSPHYAPAPGFADERDTTASRWFALKHVFDPQSAPVEQATAVAPARVPALAVFSLAGGVGKTSLVAALGRALSSRGERVLLVDTAPFGLLPFFFGARDQRPGQLRTFSPPGVSLEAPIQLVALDPESQPLEAQSPDAQGAGAGQAQGLGQGQAQAKGLAPTQPPRQDRDAGFAGPASGSANHDWLAQQVLGFSRAASRILIDLPTASGATTRRVLRLNPTVVVPVVPDMSSVVSVGAIESFFHNHGSLGGKQIMPYYVLNQFDYSLALHLDVRELLRQQIGDRLLPFALRRSPAVSEALAEGMTVIDYAPNAPLAEDYANLAAWVRSLSAPATQPYRGVRWSER